MAQRMPWDDDPIIGTVDSTAPLPSPPEKPEKAPGPPSGFRFNADGTLSYIPGGPADPNIKPGGGEKPAQVPAAISNPAEKDVGTYTSLQTSANTFQDDYGGNPFGGLENTAQKFVDVGTPGQQQWWAAFKATDNQIRNDLFGAALTATEKAAYEETTISPGMRPDLIRENVTRRAEIIKGALERKRGFLIANGYRPDAVDALFAPILANQEALSNGATENANPDVKEAAKAETGAEAPPALSAGDPGYVAATGDQRLVDDPETRSTVDQMLRAGASYDDLNQYVTSRGAMPLNRQEYAAARKALRENPNAGVTVNARKYEPVTGFEQAVTGAANTLDGVPVIEGAPAYFANAGQFLSGNTLDNLTGDPEKARLAMDVVSAQSPNAAGVGQISGGVMAGLTGEAALARLGMSSGLARGLFADTVMGAANGAGMADAGNRFGGGVTGGLTGAVGSLGGTAAAKGLGTAFSPTGGSVADLYTSGVRPTLGQRVANAGDGRGIKSVVGKTINAAEEALQSVPLVGSAIRGAREEARDQFQVGAFNQALNEIGEELPKGMRPGTDPHKFAQEAFTRVYDKARTGMLVRADDELATEIAELATDVATLGPAAEGKLKSILENNVRNRIVDGELTGAGFKKVTSDLGKQIARYRRGATAEDQALADVLEGVQGAIDRAARRHSDPDAVALLDAADAGYAKLVRIEGAAARRGGDSGTFSPKQFDAEVQRASGGIRSKAYLRGDAQMQDYAKAGMALEDKLPNSGTADRVMAGYAVGTTAAGGAIWAEPTTATILGAIGLAYAPGIRRGMKGALRPKSSASAKAIAAQLKKRARLAGAVSAASGVAALPGTVPSQ